MTRLLFAVCFSITFLLSAGAGVNAAPLPKCFAEGPFASEISFDNQQYLPSLNELDKSCGSEPVIMQSEPTFADAKVQDRAVRAKADRLALKTLKLKRQAASRVGAKVATIARRVARTRNTLGWCYAAIKVALKPFGVTLKGAAAFEAKEQLLTDKRFLIVLNLEDLQPGDILVHNRSNSHPFGHIAIYLGNEEEASDHVQPLIIGGTYGDTTVFRIKPWHPIGDRKAGSGAAA